MTLLAAALAITQANDYPARALPCRKERKIKIEKT
jgi:hypothetical protein